VKAVQAHSEGALPAELLNYLSPEFGMTVRPNHFGAAQQVTAVPASSKTVISAGACRPKSTSSHGGTEGSNPSPSTGE
jgi:hypothetical protein